MMKRILLILCLILQTCIVKISADDKVSFKASAPDAVAVGDQFRLSYVVTSTNIKDFRAPTIKGFDVLMGPSRSQQSSVQIINGNTTSTRSVTFTYILLATTEGTYTIPGATITAEGDEMISNSVQINVLPADQANGISSGGEGTSASTGNTSISNSDIFVVGNVNKTTVFEQEAILLTYKIYTAIDLRGFDNVKLPDFKGFHSQEVELTSDRKWELEHCRGRNYRSTVYRQFILFPLQTGELTIDAARFDASIAQASQVTDPFDAFFNGRNSYVEVKKSLFTPKLTIKVNPLPQPRPESFSSGVGDFSITSSINSTHIQANDAITIKVVISGTGNLKLISTPEVKFPEDFEIYDPKVESTSQLTNNGLTGSTTIEYLAIPRNPGNYKIPAVNFSYFDINSKSYKTLTTEEYQIQVDKGDGTSTQTISNFTKEDLRVLNQDIRFIKQNDVTLTPRGNYFFGTLPYWLYYIIPLLLFIVVCALYRKRISDNANIAQVKTRKANKVAVKRMKKAGKLLKDNQKDAFYDEVLQALLGYVSDKLNIPLSKLSKDNIEEELKQYGVADELVQNFIEVLNSCEYVRFAPGDANQAMDQIYESSLNIISKMEDSIKR